MKNSPASNWQVRIAASTIQKQESKPAEQAGNLPVSPAGVHSLPEITMASAAGITVAPMSEWMAILCEAATEVFSIMVGVKLNTPLDTELPVLANVTGMVGIAGTISAVFSFRCSELSAKKIASKMLGVSLEEAAPQQCDAVGEICNMVAGQFKAKIGLEGKCMLSVPTVIAGTDYTLHSRTGGRRLETPILYEGEPLWLALDVRKP
jgi:chemotaxis protein CheX